MIKLCRNSLYALLIVVALLGCASKYGYDFYDRPNWEHRHAAFVGEYIDGRIGEYFDPAWCHPRNCVKEVLSNSIILYKFVDSPHPGCTYWYETDKTTHIVVRANYRGTERQCYKLLN